MWRSNSEIRRVNDQVMIMQFYCVKNEHQLTYLSNRLTTSFGRIYFQFAKSELKIDTSLLSMLCWCCS